jgi:hypothetical protein
VWLELRQLHARLVVFELVQQQVLRQQELVLQQVLRQLALRQQVQNPALKYLVVLPALVLVELLHLAL